MGIYDDFPQIIEYSAPLNCVDLSSIHWATYIIAATCCIAYYYTHKGNFSDLIA